MLYRCSTHVCIYIYICMYMSGTYNQNKHGKHTRTCNMWQVGSNTLSLYHAHIYICIHKCVYKKIYIYEEKHIYIYTAHIYISFHLCMHITYTPTLPISLYIHMLHRFHSCPHWHPACIVHVGRLLCAESHFTCTIWDCVKTEWAITWMRASMNTLGQQTVMQLQ